MHILGPESASRALGVVTGRTLAEEQTDAGDGADGDRDPRPRPAPTEPTEIAALFD
jgi:hypothetical protein